ncbi:hypothetical protein ACU61A_00035 [Pseudonocardia sichuanensis]
MTSGSDPEPLVDVLADLDADRLDPTTAARVRADAADDPHAAAVLNALAATRADLAALADPPVPAHLSARWDAALAAEQQARPPGGAPSAGEAPADPPRATAPGPASGAGSPAVRRRPSGWNGGRRRSGSQRPGPGRLRPALVAAAVLAAAVAGGVLWAPAPPSIEEVDLVAAGLAVRGDLDVGGLADPQRRSGCLREAAPPGVAPDAQLLGGRDVVLGGRPGVLLLLATGRLGQLDVVVVDPHCGPEGGTLLGAQRIGG